jgi:hypothetical protein
VAKVVIQIEDRTNGHVAVSVTSDPAFARGDDTPAVQFGLHVAEVAFRELAAQGKITKVMAEDPDGTAILDWTPGSDNN